MGLARSTEPELKPPAVIQKMEFTGERFIPELTGEIKYEHLHRYALTLELAAGKTILDLASGEGYGASLLAQVADFVVGVDIDIDITEHASHQYLGSNLSFCVATCAAIPLADESIDLVVSFETIEHHDHHTRMMQEIKRILKPGGILVISSPNRLAYSDDADYQNPYHVKELYYDELCQLLRRHFAHQYVYGQRLATGSFVFSMENCDVSSLQTFTGNFESISRKILPLQSPTYFIAVCSDYEVPQPSSLDSVYLDRDDDLLKLAQTNNSAQLNALEDEIPVRVNEDSCRDQ